ncbi:hypothetical protein PSEUDO8Z_170064 [Pseudomonas sp. 8Z]|nr:hypothetical protein PSEUDO8Z_170064 [Pseudomonas sp. 8Z]
MLLISVSRCQRASCLHGRGVVCEQGASRQGGAKPGLSGFANFNPAAVSGLPGALAQGAAAASRVQQREVAHWLAWAK